MGSLMFWHETEELSIACGLLILASDHNDEFGQIINYSDFI